ncbi:hypothetical protein DI392_14345 [Vibrio albus]|uniref:Uncharacterized protein n=1 Tax=Vibrio albus TaxID=2200953 RepID=A0A2U3B740_9VIBR|nr:hypothetical protein [Vibrio albus]PWI32598.1 hypothetical protein DI392_14345 [Vibrio albus]
MATVEKVEAALEVFSSKKAIKDMGIRVTELEAIRDRINVVIAEMKQAAAHMGLYEINGRQFKEPIKGMASPALQAEIDIHNEHTGDEITKRDCLISVIDE